MFSRRSSSIAPNDAAAALSRGDLQLVDVREAAELTEARVEGANHIPLGQLSQRLAELDRKRPVAFLCRSGARSAVAARAAAKAGLDAVDVKGGMIAWSQAGLPLAPTSKRGGA